jgi:hypothetical protein
MAIKIIMIIIMLIIIMRKQRDYGIEERHIYALSTMNSVSRDKVKNTGIRI